MSQNHSDFLIDLKTVKIDPELPTDKKIADFVRQIKDPYHFMVGPVEVRVCYSHGGASMEDRFVDMLSTLQ